MTTIDQRILIPASSEIVWEYVSNIKNNTKWQQGCHSVSFLTSKSSGQGMRWRQTGARGDEQVIEVTAWYDGLGYQYTYIDGMPFRENMGRIRLQEIPEGTIVQWTITYQMGGMLGNMRGALGLNRRLDRLMVDSLKTLWKQVTEMKSARRMHEAKSLIREAPDAEARANYVPRHTPVIDLRVEAAEAEARGPAARTPAIDEPPVSEEDTRPRRPVTPPAEPVQPRQTIDELMDETEEPEFLHRLPDYQPPVETVEDMFTIAPDDARFRPPPAETPAQPETAPATPAQTDERPADMDHTPFESGAEQVSEPESPVPADARLETPEPPQAIQPTAPTASPPGESTTGSTRSSTGDTGPLGPLEDLSAMDTAKLSIWEIFGVPRPSDASMTAPDTEAPVVETSATEAVAEPEATEAQTEVAMPPVAALEADFSETAPTPTASAPALPSGRTGLRLYMRQQAARVRRPTSD